MKKGKFLWVFGLSAVGKKTLINQAQNINLKDNKYLEVLELKKSEKIIIPIFARCSETTREKFFEELLKTNFPYSVCLIHGQLIDIRKDILTRLKDKFPDTFDRCLFIKRSDDLNLKEEEMVAQLKKVFPNIRFIKSFVPPEFQNIKNRTTITLKHNKNEQ